MSDPENFLSRWSRRKAEANDQPAQESAQAPDTQPPANEIAQSEESPADAQATARFEKREPEFDISALPPIDSIGAGTDITAFLRAGVPAELTRAALRRAWAADPNIRDFIGLSENAWDFTAPGGVPGFGPLSADDASRLMAQFGGKE